MFIGNSYKHKSDHTFVCSKLLDLYHIRYTPKLRDTILQHYAFPSIQTVCDCLTEYAVNNIAIGCDTSDIFVLPKYSILHLKSNSKEKLVILYEISDDKITVYERKAKISFYKVEQFISMWSGIAILTNSTFIREENEYKQNYLVALRKNVGIIASIVLCLLFLGQINIINAFLPKAYLNILFVLNLLGLITTSFLVLSDVKKDNKFINKLCSLYTKLSCRQVLSSKHASLFGFIKWSEIGFCYYTLNILLFFIFHNQTLRCLLLILSTISLPYILFSVYYQVAIVKKWCMLCLAIQGIILFQFALNVFYAGSNDMSYGELFKNVFSIPVLIPVIIGFLIPFILLIFIMPLLQRGKNYEILSKKLQASQRDPLLFNHFLSMPKVINGTINYEPIVIGNRSSDKVFTIITNPNCGPCKATHKELRNLIALFSAEARIEIIFLLGAEYKKSKSYKPCLYFIKAYQESESSFLAALTEWNEAEHKNAFIKSVLNKIEVTDEADRILNKHLEWCNNFNIQTTPMIFFNQRKLQGLYTIDNVKYNIPQGR